MQGNRGTLARNLSHAAHVLTRIGKMLIAVKMKQDRRYVQTWERWFIERLMVVGIL